MLCVELKPLRVRRMHLLFFLHLTALFLNGLDRDLEQASFRAPVQAWQDFGNTRLFRALLCIHWDFTDTRILFVI